MRCFYISGYIGKQIRLERIINRDNKRTIIVPIDHGLTVGQEVRLVVPAVYGMTQMNGLKFKIGHKRPEWNGFTYDFPKKESYTQRVIKILEETLASLKNQNAGIRKFI